jgi:hypothetical protein
VQSGVFMGDASSGLMSWQCRACGKTIRTALRNAGKQLGCPQCGVRQIVPGRTGAAGSTPPSLSADSRGGQSALLAGHVRVTAGRGFFGETAWPGLLAAAVAFCGLVGVSFLLSRPGLDRHPAPASASVDQPAVRPPPTGPTVPFSSAGSRAARVVELVPPRDLEALRRGLASLAAEQTGKPGAADREIMTALVRLKMYRFLCGLPESDIVIDERLNTEALAAADICRRLGQLTHHPTNPGLSAEDYEAARRGAQSGNLAMGMTTLSAAVDAWMDDSDPPNIRAVGHRRWCLNPPLRKVGFGRVDRWSAMWAHDMSGPSRLPRSAVCYPPPGPVPIDLFRPHYAWSVSLDPRRFVKPRLETIRVAVCSRARAAEAGELLPLDPLVVDTSGFGIDNCIIFKPVGLSTAAGAGYVVVIEGLEDHDGHAITLRYITEFVE